MIMCGKRDQVTVTYNLAARPSSSTEDVWWTSGAWMLLQSSQIFLSTYSISLTCAFTLNQSFTTWRTAKHSMDGVSRDVLEDFVTSV